MDLKEAIDILGDSFGFTSPDTYPVAASLGLKKDADVLDIGTGIGSMAIVLALNGFNVLTSEPSEDDSAYAKREWQANADKVGVVERIRFEAFSAQDIPHKDEQFDAVFCQGSFHHIDENFRAKALAEFYRVIRPGGVACLFEPNAKALAMIMSDDPEHPDAADPEKYLKKLPFSMEIRKGKNFNAYILKKS